MYCNTVEQMFQHTERVSTDLVQLQNANENALTAIEHKTFAESLHSRVLPAVSKSYKVVSPQRKSQHLTVLSKWNLVHLLITLGNYFFTRICEGNCVRDKGYGMHPKTRA